MSTSMLRRGAAAIAVSLAMLTAAPGLAYAERGDVTIGGVNIKELGITGIDPSNLDVDTMKKLLDNPLVGKYAVMCRTGQLASEGGAATVSTGSATVDCSKSTGTGAAVVLPSEIDLANAAEDVVVDLGPDIDLLLVRYKMGQRNLVEILGGVAINPNSTTANLANTFGFGRADPSYFDNYKTVQALLADASLPVEMINERYCSGIPLGSSCIGTWKTRTYDKNLAKRTEAINVIAYLTNKKIDPTKPFEYTPVTPNGSATIAGPGINIAAAMTGGNASATTALTKLGLAAAAAADGRTSTADATLGMATALNMDTDKIGLTWFGNALDFTKLKEAGVLKNAGPDAEAMLDQLGNLKLPALKEVSCYGMVTRAKAEGLGECSNALGIFDYYKDLRPATDGSVRQTQWGLTDPTSLVLGQGNVLGQVFGGDSAPFMQNMLSALTSEDVRIKLAKDFLRLTQEETTTVTSHPVVDSDGNPVLGEDGKPLVQTTPTTTSKTLLTSDYGLRNPVVLNWLGYELSLFGLAQVNGTSRPNYLALPTLSRTGSFSIVPKLTPLVWDNPFGLGTFDGSAKNPISSWASSVTLPKDVKLALDTAQKLSKPATTPSTDSATPTTSARTAPSIAASSASSSSATSDSSSSSASSSAAPSTPATPAPSAPSSAAPSTSSASESSGTSSGSSSESSSEATSSDSSSSSADSASTSSTDTASASTDTSGSE